MPICLRCNAEWEARKPKPINCPRCKSPQWDQPRKTDAATSQFSEGFGYGKSVIAVATEEEPERPIRERTLEPFDE